MRLGIESKKKEKAVETKISIFGGVSSELKELESRLGKSETGIEIMGVSIQGNGYGTFVVLKWKEVGPERGVPMFHLVELEKEVNLERVKKAEEDLDPEQHGLLVMVFRLPAMQVVESRTNFVRGEQVLVVRQNHRYFEA